MVRGFHHMGRVRDIVKIVIAAWHLKKLQRGNRTLCRELIEALAGRGSAPIT